MHNTTKPTAEEAQRLAERAGQALAENDKSSRHLGIRLVEIRPGYARMAMSVRAEMVNGHRICHGGMVFTLADTAFAYACNSHNDNTVAATASIDFLAPAYEDDELAAVATELWRTTRNGIYEIIVTNQREERIALFRGRSYRIDGQLVSGD
jgi:acyl-CoA thioesterase